MHIQKNPTKNHSYEIVLVIRPDLSVAAAHAFGDTIEKICGVSMRQREYWGLRTLAYPIRKKSKAHYIYMLTEEMPKENLATLNREIKYNTELFRALIVKHEGKTEFPTTLIQATQQHAEEPSVEEDVPGDVS